MAVPHYAYFKMKMPGNNGTPSIVHGSFLRSYNCDKEFNRIAQKFAGNGHLALADKTNPNTPAAKVHKTLPIEIHTPAKEGTMAKDGEVANKKAAPPPPADPSAS